MGDKSTNERRVTLRIPTGMFLKLDVLAQKKSMSSGNNISLNFLVRQAIAEFLEREVG